MTRQFKTVDYDKSLEQTVTIEECVPPGHLARFIVDTIQTLDLGCIYGRYGTRGGEPYAPEILLGLLFYGYATGVVSSRKIEKATYESIPFRFIAGGLHPDHDTIAHFRKTFLFEFVELFAQVLLMAKEVGILKLDNISLDGSKVHADASKSKAVSYKRLLELDSQLRAEVEELFALGEAGNESEWPEGLDIVKEIIIRRERLTNLTLAKAELEKRAEERYRAEKAGYEAKIRARREKEQQTGRKPRGRMPQPPTPGARDKDQYNFTDPGSRVMKNSTNSGFDQHYNVQLAVDQDSFLIVANTTSNHANDQNEAIPTLDAIPTQVGKPQGAALDNGYFSKKNITEIKQRGITPYIATGREPHHKSWRERFAETSAPPPADASSTVKMAYQLQTKIGKVVYGLRKCTVEPVIGIIKEIMGFRQFSLRGLAAAAGEWCLVCLAFNLKRLHVLLAS